MLEELETKGSNTEERSKLKNVSEVARLLLCTGCGTCAGICPTHAIEMRRSEGILIPQIERGKCTDCGLCLSCCPGHSVDFSGLETRISGNQPADCSLGRYQKCYIGHSTDSNIRGNSASGGIITQLLVFALDRGLIDGALVTVARSDNPLEPSTLLARTREDIMSASKSKYCPTATGSALRQLLKEEGRFAVVGLPCHIHGFRKAEKVIEPLRKKIVLHIGLVCSHMVNFLGTEMLLHKLGLSPDCVKTISYRGNGWPGSMVISTKDNRTITIPYTGSWKAYWPLFSSFFFVPKRCLMCWDETNELADVSVGDAWLPELRRQKKGESIVISRTKIGEEILKSGQKAGVISLVPIDSDKVKISQASPLKFKKKDLDTRLTLIAARGFKVPSFNPKPVISRSFPCFARNVFALFNNRISEKRNFGRLSVCIPLQLFRAYFGIYKFLCIL